MVIVLSLLGYALLTMVAAPTVIRGRWPVGHPRSALSMWYGFFATGLLAAGASLIVAVALATRHEPASIGWNDPTILTFFSCIALGVLGGAIALVTDRTEPLLHEEHSVQHRLAGLAARLTYRTENVAEFGVSYVTSDHAFVCAMPGRAPQVLVSSPAEVALSRAELLAVVEHERTHVRQHHAAVLRLAKVNAACLPGVAGAQALLRSTALLLELVADDAAARNHGHETTARTLRTMGEQTGDDSLLLRADRIQTRRPGRSGRH